MVIKTNILIMLNLPIILVLGNLLMINANYFGRQYNFELEIYASGANICDNIVKHYGDKLVASRYIQGNIETLMTGLSQGAHFSTHLDEKSVK